jgi:probable HAF family extracellular repeat protein
MTDLGTLGTDAMSAATGINDRGQVVGWSKNAAGRRHAFLWQNGTMTALGTSGETWSEAADINERGLAVGWGFTSPGRYHALLWKDGATMDFGTLGGTESSAYAINNRDQIVGAIQMPPRRMVVRGHAQMFILHDNVLWCATAFAR